MKIIPFFRLPIISFIISFVLLFALLVLKLNDIAQQGLLIEYQYSPDFMRIIGSCLFIMMMMSLSLHYSKIYLINIRNVIFVLLSIILILLVTYWCDASLTNIFISSIDLQNPNGYKIYQFWYPVISRILFMIVTIIILQILSFFVKHRLKWQDEVSPADLTLDGVIKVINLIYFASFYLAINFIFQRYLYIAVYLFFGGGNLPEYHNFAFYLAAIMTALLLVMFINKKTCVYHEINSRLVIKIASLTLLSQLMISIIISGITIYAIQYYFVLTYDEANYFANYITLLYAMLNSIFIVSILTCLLSYYSGRFWLKKYRYFVS